MLYLKDILDTDKLEDLILNKRINVQVHPDLPLRVYNYSNMAQFANEWSHEERVCRGLIVGPDDEIIARGPSKFFNYGQPGAPEVAMDDTVWVTRKEDGSLGIGWHYEGHYGIATRGSFTSEQAQHATAMLTDMQKQMIAHQGQTQIYEIVYPENRIVLDYGDLDKLIPLGAVDNRDGVIGGRAVSVFYGAESYGFKYQMTFAEALALPIPDNEEGYVLDVFETEDSGTMRIVGHLKLKGEAYLQKHKLVFGLTSRTIYDHVVTGTDDKYIQDIPDEFQPWAKAVATTLRSEFYGKMAEINKHFNLIEVRDNRKEFALQAKSSAYAKYLFLLLDGRTDTLESAVWASLKPELERPSTDVQNN